MSVTLGLTLTARANAMAGALSNDTTYYIALLLALGSAEDGSDVVEAAGSGYARASTEGWVAGGIALGGASGTFVLLKNENDVNFPELTGALGPIVGYAIYDAAVEGNCLGTGMIMDASLDAPNPQTYAAGDVPLFSAGTIFMGLAPIVQ
jgi:hypothetical protein